MREARQKMTEKYLADPEKYFADLEEVTKKFLAKRAQKHETA